MKNPQRIKFLRSLGRLALFFSLLPLRSGADEGMWLPMLLQETVYHDMQNEGLKLSPEDIYSINQASLKDAVVQYGAGCTGAMISAEGLMLTNHHCALGRIQSLSSVANDYVTNGFWAKSRSEELPVKGISVTFIIRMEDVTSRVLGAMKPETAEAARNRIVDSVSKVIAAEALAGTKYTATVRPFYYGNQYFLIVSEVFKDVRFVGAPPRSVGDFGGEADNWIWPRHTADFALFRVYAGKDNTPADYSPENVPLRPRHYFPVSLSGVKENDFAMVLGFPGRTSRYITSYGVELVQNVSNPAKISVRDVRLKIWDKHMKANDTVRLKYASKYNGLSNYWKRWQGEIYGMKKADVVAKKRAYEEEFSGRIKSNPGWYDAYGALLTELKLRYDTLRNLQPVMDYYTEALQAPEIWKVAPMLQPLVDSMLARKAVDSSIQKMITKIKTQLDGFYRDYDAAADEEMTAAMLELYGRNAGAELTPVELGSLIQKYGANYADLSRYIFKESILDNPDQLTELLTHFRKGSEKKIINDPAYALSVAIAGYYRDFILPPHARVSESVSFLQRRYMQSQQTVFRDQLFFPEANLTLRVAYGKVKPYESRDAVHLNYFTTLDGLLEKYKPGDEFYDAPPQLAALALQKDFGRYADADGSLHTCFITTSQTSSGNSGSPVVDATGNLIGLNFDRCWEGTVGDYYYDAERFRNIAVDIRYVLFIIDKLAGAGYLLDEMTFAK
jgi:hypothetical protein